MTLPIRFLRRHYNFCPICESHTIPYHPTIYIWLDLDFYSTVSHAVDTMTMMMMMLTITIRAVIGPHWHCWLSYMDDLQKIISKPKQSFNVNLISIRLLSTSVLLFFSAIGGLLSPLFRTSIDFFFLFRICCFFLVYLNGSPSRLISHHSRYLETNKNTHKYIQDLYLVCQTNTDNNHSIRWNDKMLIDTVND